MKAAFEKPAGQKPTAQIRGLNLKYQETEKWITKFAKVLITHLLIPGSVYCKHFFFFVVRKCFKYKQNCNYVICFYYLSILKRLKLLMYLLQRWFKGI